VTTPAEAAAIAEELLARDLPRRWAHTRGVAGIARTLTQLATPDGDVLEAAAWLHDIGYATSIAETGFHPLDGAQHLRRIGVCPDVVTLVATHTNASVEAHERGLAAALAAFTGASQRTARLHPLLAYCDMTTSPDGAAVNVDDRLLDIYSRYPAGTVVHRSIARAESDLRRQTEAVREALTQARREPMRHDETASRHIARRARSAAR